MAGTVQGTGNRLVTPDLIANEALFRLMDALVIPRLANRSFEKYFAGKIGNRITIKRPYKAKVTSGRVMGAVSPLIDLTLDVMVDQRNHFPISYNDEERTLSIVAFGERYLQAGVEELAYAYDIAGADELGLSLFYREGTPGTGLSTRAALNIAAHARHVAIPLNSMNFGLIDPLDFANVSDDVKMIHVPDTVSQSIRERYRGMLAGYHLFESVNIPYLEVAALPGTPLVNGGSESGGSITMDGFTASAKVLLKGQLISLAGVKEIQPRGKRRKTGRDMSFTVQEDVTSNSSGQASVKISPDLNDGTATTVDSSGTSVSLAAFKNVDGKPANNAIVTIVGTAGESYRQGLFYEKSALEYVNVQLEQFESAVLKGRATEEQTGLSVSLTGWLDGEKMEEIQRVDSLFGVKTVYPDLGIRFISDKV